MVFVYDTLEYKPDGRLKKLAALLKEKAQVVTFEKQSQRALTDWVVKHFQAVKNRFHRRSAQSSFFRPAAV